MLLSLHVMKYHSLTAVVQSVTKWFPMKLKLKLKRKTQY